MTKANVATTDTYQKRVDKTSKSVQKEKNNE